MKKTILLPLIALVAISFSSCDDVEPKKKKKNISETSKISISKQYNLFFKISLAEWSFHRAIKSGEMSPYDFAKKAKELDFEGLEYVSYLYKPEIDKYPTAEEGVVAVVKRLKEESEKYNIPSLLIMVDAEGNLADTDDANRKQAVENHKKWVDAAAELGCHSIRVNLSGSNQPETWIKASTESLKSLSQYAVAKDINVIVENHGGLSSNAALLTQVMEQVEMENCGTLPDFGNFCIRSNENGCAEEYDRYLGTKEMMPFAKAVSAKSYNFDNKGEETTIDYKKILQIVKDAGYKGYIGVEYEGEKRGETNGVITTRNMLVNIARELK